jgi:glycosyltransferase involved in cell wall biosynthesis
MSVLTDGSRTVSEHADPAQTVTAITLTRHRPRLVQRAMRSVREQRTPAAVSHVVLIDDCPDTLAALNDLPSRPGTEILYLPRQPHEVSGPSRSSRLRNFGVRRSSSRWIAFLDDDNEWTPDHLDGLLDCARRRGVRAAYSEVCLLNKDGSPYLEPRWPWAHDNEEAERIYLDYVAKGVCVPGSNIIRDRPGTAEVPVDSSAWLLSRDLLLEVPFEEHFTERDARDLVGEDDKLFWALAGRREPMACTGQPTLRYYLGGYSNNPDAKTDQTFSWSSE